MWDPNLDWMLFSFGLYEPSCQCRRFDRCVFTILRPLGSRFILQCIHPVMRSFFLSFECSLCAHRCAHTCSAIVIVLSSISTLKPIFHGRQFCGHPVNVTLNCFKYFLVRLKRRHGVMCLNEILDLQII